MNMETIRKPQKCHQEYLVNQFDRKNGGVTILIQQAFTKKKKINQQQKRLNSVYIVKQFIRLTQDLYDKAIAGEEKNGTTRT